MNIQFVAFYPLKWARNRSLQAGTIHVRVVELCMEFRGIYIFKSSKDWMAQLPCQYSVDKHTNQKVKYPVIEFTNPDQKMYFLRKVVGLFKDNVIKTEAPRAARDPARIRVFPKNRKPNSEGRNNNPKKFDRQSKEGNVQKTFQSSQGDQRYKDRNSSYPKSAIKH
jgi:hypothetical protein